MPIPDLPGTLLPSHSEQCRYLKSVIARMCRLDPDRFPGSQPVSFSTQSLSKLENEDFWVCEKSDGVRVLLFIYTVPNSPDQSVYVIDRHNDYRQLDGIFFPNHENPQRPMRTTLVDGELVMDVDPVSKKETMRFLAFDCLIADEQVIMSRPLDKRYGRLTEWFYKPFSRMLHEFPNMANNLPFQIKVKEINMSYYAEKVFAVDIPALHHGNDGLIYTNVNTPYIAGATDSNILKWKPPSENSIDFKLVLRFPPSSANPSVPDFYAKPFFGMHVWCGGKGDDAKYELFDELFVTDEEWESMKESGEQYDDRIIEVHWDAEGSHWRYMRFRDDKPAGNHRSVVDKIISSIVDGVEKDELLARSNNIRNAWKARHGSGQPPPGGTARSSFVPPRQPVTDLRRYGPLANSDWSRVAGPAQVAGMNR